MPFTILRIYRESVRQIYQLYIKTTTEKSVIIEPEYQALHFD